MTDQTKDLLACPFCGGEAKLNQHEGSASNIDDINSGAQWIECTKCGASTNLRFSLLDDCRPLLAEQWNRRASATSAPVQTLQPLSDDELDLICYKALFCKISKQQFARSIEAAHGITGNSTPVYPENSKTIADHTAQVLHMVGQPLTDAVMAEREACAKLCDFLEFMPVPNYQYGTPPAKRYANNKDLAAAIRAQPAVDHTAQVLHMVGQPLTDEQILAMRTFTGDGANVVFDKLAFARAIESAVRANAQGAANV